MSESMFDCFRPAFRFLLIGIPSALAGIGMLLNGGPGPIHTFSASLALCLDGLFLQSMSLGVIFSSKLKKMTLKPGTSWKEATDALDAMIFVALFGTMFLIGGAFGVYKHVG